MNTQPPIREIPYNYTSFSDREVILRLINQRAWDIFQELRQSRETGISAHMLLEMLGDMWIVHRNPYIQDDLNNHSKRLNSLLDTLEERVVQITQRAGGNELTLELIALVSKAVHDFGVWLRVQPKRREQARKAFKGITHNRNVCFDGLARVSHVTDATDWRVELPFVVLVPDSEKELRLLVKACIDIGLTVIPRGGGTGYTGGAIPLHRETAIINTEKLESISELVQRDDVADGRTVPVVRCGAGVVTKRVSEFAQRHGLVFAVDPTSQDASTIGGNVSMNAGGKKAVLWGTTLDNLVSWRIVTPDARWLEVTRINHNMGKLHDQETVEFECQYYDEDGTTPVGEPELMRFPGTFFRKDGLGKDVTDKFLGGLPGIQKEGCDGLISSAEFVLHRMPTQIRTVCLEFYGTDLHEAIPAIIEVKDYIDRVDGLLLSGLEHLDERYIKAVNYTPKSAGGQLPKMVLIADIVGDDERQLAAASSQVLKLAKARHAEGFIAISPEARRQFWLDRSRTAAIAAHTNAFKINEDVVIPLPNLAKYSEAIERINIRLSIQNKLMILEQIKSALQEDIPALRQLPGYESSVENDERLQSKLATANQHIETVQQRWSKMLDSFEQPANECHDLLAESEIALIRVDDNLIQLLLRRDCVVSYHDDVEAELNTIFAGGQLAPLREIIKNIHQKALSSRLFIALHMHAGDGNVHTNIPVNSNDYQMMHEAELVVDEIMQIAIELDGVISGEHGIGLTKTQYQDKEAINRFAEYKQKVDPEGRFNKGKLMPGSGLQDAYTPSLRLVEREALLLKHHALSKLNDDIKDCLRCGKCKPVCSTHIPRANLLYSPRNKILSTGLIIEAFLYEEQTQRGIALNHFAEMNDIADHCTVCHKCLSPCPVNIDFGDVSINMRQILRDRKQKKTNPITWASMQFLNVTDPRQIKLMRSVLIRFGYWAQAFGHGMFKRLGLLKKGLPSNTTVKPTITEYVIEFVDKPLPKQLAAKTMRASLNLEDDKVIPILSDQNKQGDSVFYFPGCGSERLFSEVGIATLAMLYETGATTVLPPGYLCCGYPQNATGYSEKGSQISTENRVLFHRIAQTLRYLDIKTVIVSCGTCMDQLLKYEFEKIFPGCRLLDIHEYLEEKNVTMKAIKGKEQEATEYLYHDPCHSPIKTTAPTPLVSKLMAKEVQLSDRCCGEAGTFAVSRPDIASQLRFRKEEEINLGIKNIKAQSDLPAPKVKMLTSCPACQQGLARYSATTGVEAGYVVVELAKNNLGDNWQQDFIDTLNDGGIERVML
ncbi:MAG TPA: DUF3683 domain-containing protein [Thiotrichaceae bacterium]|nr:DUF3683 domain-containing protein [Thiotrichaceae bacterium]